MAEKKSAPNSPPSAMENLDTATVANSDDALIGWGRTLYEAFVRCDADAMALEKLGRSIFAKRSWGQLDTTSRLIMVRTVLLIQPDKTDVKVSAAETKTE